MLSSVITAARSIPATCISSRVLNWGPVTSDRTTVKQRSSQSHTAVVPTCSRQPAQPCWSCSSIQRPTCCTKCIASMQVRVGSLVGQNGAHVPPVRRCGCLWPVLHVRGTRCMYTAWQPHACGHWCAPPQPPPPPPLPPATQLWPSTSPSRRRCHAGPHPLLQLPAWSQVVARWRLPDDCQR